MNEDVISALAVLTPLIAAAWRWLARGHSARAEVKADHAELCRRLGLEDQSRHAAHEARVLILTPDIIKSRRMNWLRVSRADAWAGGLFGVAAGLTAFQHYFDGLGTLALGAVQLVLALIAYRLVVWETDQVQNLVAAAAQRVAATQEAQDKATAKKVAAEPSPVPAGRVSVGERITRAWRELTRH